jgi:prophage regulatory protein
MTPGTAQLSTVLRLREVQAMTGRSCASIYADMAAGRMPRQIKLGPRAVGWLRADIERWLAERIAERDRATESTGAAR